MRTMYPVYEVSRHDFTRDCEPVGQASSEEEALAIMQKWFVGTGASVAMVELNDRDQLWAYWPIFA